MLFICLFLYLLRIPSRTASWNYNTTSRSKKCNDSNTIYVWYVIYDCKCVHNKVKSYLCKAVNLYQVVEKIYIFVLLFQEWVNFFTP